MTASVLLDELRQRGATVGIVNGHLRIEVPRRHVTPELRQLVANHRDELRVLLAATLPAPDPRRLDLDDCLALLNEMHAGIRADYIEGALPWALTEPDLARRFRQTEDRIDALAKAGPTEADFRGALADHAELWREIVARARAFAEVQDDFPESMRLGAPIPTEPAAPRPVPPPGWYRCRRPQRRTEKCGEYE